MSPSLPLTDSARRIPIYPLVAAVLAATAPTLLAYNLPPSATVLNQCLAVSLWGSFILAIRPAPGVWRTLALWGALLGLAAGALTSCWLGSLPGAMTISALALLAGAGVLIWAGSGVSGRPASVAVFAAFASALAFAGLASTVVALIQVFAPGLADGNVIAHSGVVGRAVGNLRQPNHLCSLLLWATIAVVALMELGLLRRHWAVAAVVVLVFAVELSGSRTGAAGLVLLVLWGALDRRMSRNARLLLIATPLIYGLSFAFAQGWSAISEQAVGAGARIAAESGSVESPNSRPRIWANAIELIRQQPWFGVGFGEFNAAWTLTPFPGRPTAFFDHTHNLPLQLAVELGLPLAGLVLAFMSWALWQAWRRSRAESEAGPRVAATAAWMIVAMILLHSLVEYPLWYSYFLLPAAFAWGYALGAGPGSTVDVPAEAEATRQPSAAGVVAGVVMVLGGAVAIYDYMRVVVVYAPNENSGPLAERILSGQHSVFFAQHADYAAATVAEPIPSRALGFKRAPHYLLDVRLMTAWADYLAKRGEVDKARALAARIREFRNADAAAYFAPCENNPQQAYQCQPPEAPHPWREYFKAP